MNKIYILTDYKNIFGSKHNATPYRSGMDKDLLKKYFEIYEFEAIFLKYSDINFRKMNFKDQYVLYTSSEDIGGLYKNYIEDIIYGLHIQGAKIIPDYKYLKAHNNKVFMEILRDLTINDKLNFIQSHYFGTLEELINNINKIELPVVIKSAAGAMSRGVYIANNRNELIKNAKKISRSKYIFDELWDLGRAIKHKGYIKESKYRNKFIVQNFIPGLENDWKILIYGEKYYILYRGVRDNDFRASGSHKFIFKEDIPDGILDFAKLIFDILNVPNLSIDVAFDGNKFHLLEFQAIYYGTTTIVKSPFYFNQINNKWEIIKETSILEKIYVESIVNFINK